MSARFVRLIKGINEKKRKCKQTKKKNKKSEMGIRFGKVRLVVCNIENWKTGLCSDNLIF